MKKNAIIVGIAGASASGKTLVSKTICNDLGQSKVLMIPEDSYYKDLANMPISVREKVNFDHPEAFDHQLCHKQLADLQALKEIDLPIYDYEKHTRKTETKRLKPAPIIILEGILIFSDPKLRSLMDIKIFIDTPLDICLTRRIKRDIEERGRQLDSILEQYSKTVRPMYLQFIEPSKRYADIIIPRGGKNHIAIDMIKAKFNELVAELHEQ